MIRLEVAHDLKHLSQVERYQIYAFKQASLSLRAIAKQLGRSTSTISRELIRNKGLHGYCPKQAHELSACKDAHSRNASIISVHVFEQAHKLIERDYSPEQAAPEEGVSHETVYRYINGKDFAMHARISNALRCKWYFADPYCSWQRGCNENYNGLVRQYIPKRLNLSLYQRRK